MIHPTEPSPGLLTRMPRRTSAAAALPAVRALRTVIAAAAFAATVALLALLPAFGQSATFDRTDGEVGSGSGLSVGVFADIADAQVHKNRETTYTNQNRVTHDGLRPDPRSIG